MNHEPEYSVCICTKIYKTEIYADFEGPMKSTYFLIFMRRKEFFENIFSTSKPMGGD